jgi:thymidylate kinase
MSPRGLLISFSGIDGTGKSTIARQLQQLLSSNYGIASRYVWCKFGDHPLSHYRLVKSSEQSEFKSWLAPREPMSFPSPLNKIYGGMMLAFHLTQIALVILGALKRGEFVICDRYIFDTMVDLQQDLHYSAEQARKILDAGWIPQPRLKFLLDISEQIAFARKPDSNSPEYLKRRRTLYLDVARKYKLDIVDASQPIEAVCLSVMQRIKAQDLQEVVCR